MCTDFKFKIIGNAGVLNISLWEINSFRILPDSNFNINRILYFFHLGTRRIMCCKLSLYESINEINCTDVASEKSCKISNSTSFYFLKVLNLPIEVNHLVSCNQGLWAVGSKNCLDLKFHTDKLFQEPLNRNANDNSMDTSMEDEFQLTDHELVIERQYLLKLNVQDNFFCFECNLIQNGLGICYEDIKESSWSVILTMPNSVSSIDAEALKYIPLFKFPLSFYQNSFVKGTERKPVILFYDSNHKIWNTLLKSQQQTSNHLCLIGHPEGKILYCSYTWSNQKLKFKLLTEVQQFHDIKQGVLGIHFCESIADIEGPGFLIIVGEMGKVTLISLQPISSESSSIHLTIGSLWITTVQLPLPIKSYTILNGCILYLSTKRDLWISKFKINKKRNSNGGQCLQLLNEATYFCEIMHLLIINQTKGLFLTITNTGTMYLMQCSTNGKSVATHIDLPSSMNGILKQSLILKELSLTKEWQSKLFASISTLAKLKFRDGNKIHVDCQLTEVEGPPRKFILDLSLKITEHFNFCPKFWFITASLYSHFEMDSAIVSKSKPLDSDSNLCIEVLESIICPSYNSPFPLYLEFGLILCLPKEVETIDCFKALTKKLPFYVRTHTFVLNELNLLKNKEETHKIQLFTSDVECNNIFQRINYCNLRSPVYKFLNKNQSLQNLICTCNEFTLCLLESHAKNMIKLSNKGSNLSQSVLQIFGNKSYLQEIDGNKLVCRDKPIILSVAHRGNIIYITVSSKCIVLLLGLRMAIAESLLNNQDNSSDIANCVKIPASLLKKCEVLSSEFLDMHGKDVTESDFLGNVLKEYHKLRTEISQNIPY